MVGFFLVPKDKSDVLIEILVITGDKLKKQVLNMFGKFIPGIFFLEKEYSKKQFTKIYIKIC